MCVKLAGRCIAVFCPIFFLPMGENIKNLGRFGIFRMTSRATEVSSLPLVCDAAGPSCCDVGSEESALTLTTPSLPLSVCSPLPKYSFDGASLSYSSTIFVLHLHGTNHRRSPPNHHVPSPASSNSRRHRRRLRRRGRRAVLPVVASCSAFDNIVVVVVVVVAVDEVSRRRRPTSPPETFVGHILDRRGNRHDDDDDDDDDGDGDDYAKTTTAIGIGGG